MALDMYHKIIALLDGAGVTYERFEHEHVHSSHDAAKIRGTRLEEAAKAIVLETGSGRIIQCIVSGHRRLDLKKLKLLLKEKDVRLAHPEKVFEATGCTIGSVPPFGNLFTPPLPVYADQDVFSREHVVFSAGSHNHSVRMLAKDWAAIVQPQIADIGKDAEPGA
jgi:prolyl-tRNA editing enzyme YbaK/EbsC (Cys-tRNA(Pro) deacylase)